MPGRGKQVRRRTRNSTAGNMRRRLNQTARLTTQISPFQVRRNRQLLSIPSHRENGLNIERTFRFNLAAPDKVINMQRLMLLIRSELGVDFTTANPVRVTVKQLTVYSLKSFACQVYYTSVDPSSNAVNMSQFNQYTDYTNNAGIASLSVVYPIEARPEADTRSSAPQDRILFGMEQLQSPDIWVLDVRCYVSVNNSGQPTMLRALREQHDDESGDVLTSRLANLEV